MRIQDGGWTLAGYDAPTGRSLWRCDDGGRTHYRIDYPVDDLIKENACAFNESAGERFGGGRCIASVPLNLFFEQLQEAQSQGDERYLARWLNDPDNRAFRTFRGRV